MKRFLATGVAATLLLALLLSISLPPLVLAVTGPSALETQLTAEGASVRAFASSSIAATRLAQPNLLVVQTVTPALDVERREARSFVEAGGVLWLSVTSREVVETWLDEPPLLLSGHLFDATGHPARFHGADTSAATAGLLAWDVTGSRFRPVVNTTAAAFRDTNGNGRLDAGEPRGPFAVVVAADVGAGTAVLIGTADDAALAELAPLLLEPELDEIALVSDAGAMGFARPGAMLLRLASLPLADTASRAVLILVVTLSTVLIASRSGPSLQAAETLTPLLEAYEAQRHRPAPPSQNGNSAAAPPFTEGNH